MVTSSPAPLNRPAALCLVLAPLILTTGDLLQILNFDSIARTVALWLAFVIFVPSIFTLYYLFLGRLPRLALLAGSIPLLGTTAGAAMQEYFRTRIALRQSDLNPATVTAVESALQGHMPLHLTTLVPGALFPLGLLLFVVTLGWSARVPRGVALLLGLGAVPFPVGHAAGVAMALLGGDLVLLGALSWIAVHVATRLERWQPRVHLGAKEFGIA